MRKRFAQRPNQRRPPISRSLSSSSCHRNGSSVSSRPIFPIRSSVFFFFLLCFRRRHQTTTAEKTVERKKKMRPRMGPVLFSHLIRRRSRMRGCRKRKEEDNCFEENTVFQYQTVKYRRHRLVPTCLLNSLALKVLLFPQKMRQQCR